MSYPKLIECMKLFSHESLRQYLGDDLVGQLLTEWENNGPVTKKRLAEMIVQLNGIDLLKKPIVVEEAAEPICFKASFK